MRMLPNNIIWKKKYIKKSHWQDHFPHAFVKDKWILDQILITNEAVGKTRRKKKMYLNLNLILKRHKI